MKNGNHCLIKSGIIKNRLFLFPLLLISSALVISCVTYSDDSLGNDEGQWYPGDGIWLRGDLHIHSLYSDGDSPIPSIIQASKKSNLDFIAVTDHDTSQGGEILSWSDPGYDNPPIMMLYGTEWTSRTGHANILSAVPFNYSVFWEANRKKDYFLALTAAQTVSAVFSMNHAIRITPSWKYPVSDFSVMEIWNASFRFPTGNRQIIDTIWVKLLMSGRRVTGIGGSDSHKLHGIQSRVNPPGYPTTWVYADQKSPRAVIDAIKEGRVSVSYAPAGPRLELTADADGDGVFETGMGGTVQLNPRSRIKVRAAFQEISRWAPRHFRIILYGDDKIIASKKITPADGFSVMTRVDRRDYKYFRAELHGPPKGNMLFRYLTGNTLAISNPIYTEDKDGSP